MLLDMAEGAIRIGELSRRVGVSPELLRAWETRYRLVTPERTPGGLRLYSAADERRVRVMQREMASGLSAAEAARVALRSELPAVSVAEVLEDLDATLGRLDETSAQAALDRAFASLSLPVVIGDVLLPFLRSLGDRWEAGQKTVAEEHFASHVIAGRLRNLARGWGEGTGPRVVLACPEGERHELGLICFGLLLRERGWSVSYLGADTPLDDPAIPRLDPRLVVIATTTEAPLIEAAAAIKGLSRTARVAVGGPGASAALGRQLEVDVLPTDLLEAVRAVA